MGEPEELGTLNLPKDKWLQVDLIEKLNKIYWFLKDFIIRKPQGSYLSMRKQRVLESVSVANVFLAPTSLSGTLYSKTGIHSEKD